MMIDNNRKKDDNRGEGNMLKWKKALRISRMFLLFLIVAVLIPEDVLITAAKAQTVVDTQQGTEDVILDDNEKAETKQEELSTEEEDTPEPEPLLRGLIRDEKGNLYFYKDGEKLRNSWKTVKGNKYYFGKSGKAYTGKKRLVKQPIFLRTAESVRPAGKRSIKRNIIFHRRMAKW